MAKFYVTTPIYYVNDAPHIGHAYTTIIGDSLARWHRLLGDDVFFLTGTDEYGLKNQRSAEALGLEPKALADGNSERFRQAWAELGISNDDFIRTTEPRHTKAVQKFLQAVYDNGDIEAGTYEGLYCVACEAYYTESELIDGKCPIHLRPVERMQERNWFFKLSRYQDRLLEWYEANPGAVYPDTRRNEVVGFVKQGLQDISISRSTFQWGVPLPWDESQVSWVWFDALPNYITAVGYAEDDQRFSYWWPADVHLVGKDILRFHAVFWPAMLMAAGIEPPRCVAAHGWLLVGGAKMSKTSLNQIAPSELIADFGVDGVRYHFLRDTPFGPDGDFSYEGMVARYNADLANNLGNLLSRVATVVQSKCGGIGPAPAGDSPLRTVAEDAYRDAAAAWERLAPSDTLDATWSLMHAANAHLEANEPWKTDPGPALDTVMGAALEVLRIVAVLAWPAIPASSEEVWRRLGLAGSPAEQRLPEAAGWGGHPGGTAVEKGAPLFPRRK